MSIVNRCLNALFVASRHLRRMRDRVAALLFPRADSPRTALFLCTSPFQARMLERIRTLEGIDRYDLVFLVHANNPKSRRYHAALAAGARSAVYRVLPSHIPPRDRVALFPAWLLCRSYDTVHAAIVTPWYMRMLLSMHGDAEFQSFDDGWGNLVEAGAPLIALEQPYDRQHARRLGQPLSGLLARSTRHYSIDPSQPCMFPKAELRPIRPFDAVVLPPADRGVLVLIVGSPDHALLSETLFTELAHRVPDCELAYAPHPREPLAPVLEVLGSGRVLQDDRILEDLVCDLRLGGQHVTLIGSRSTTHLTIHLAGVNKIYVSATDPDPFAALAHSAGCIVLKGRRTGTDGRLSIDWSQFPG